MSTGKTCLRECGSSAVGCAKGRDALQAECIVARVTGTRIEGSSACRGHGGGGGNRERVGISWIAVSVEGYSEASADGFLDCRQNRVVAVPCLPNKADSSSSRRSLESKPARFKRKELNTSMIKL